MIFMNIKALTSLSFMANMIALACSAAFPTIGSKMTLMNATGMLKESDAPCKKPNISLVINTKQIPINQKSKPFFTNVHQK